MHRIELHFTERFEGETVVVTIDGRPPLTLGKLVTDYRTSLARIVPVELPEGRARVTVEVHRGGENKSMAIAIDPAECKQVVVSLREDRLVLTPVSDAELRREPRGYA